MFLSEVVSIHSSRKQVIKLLPINLCLFLHENEQVDPGFSPFVQFLIKFLSSFFKEGHFEAKKTCKRHG